MKYMAGFRPECGCVTAGLVVSLSSPEDVGEFVASMIKTGREFRLQDTPVILERCTHERSDETSASTPNTPSGG